MSASGQRANALCTSLQKKGYASLAGHIDAPLLADLRDTVDRLDSMHSERESDFLAFPHRRAGGEIVFDVARAAAVLDAVWAILGEDVLLDPFP